MSLVLVLLVRVSGMQGQIKEDGSKIDTLGNLW